MGNSTKLCDLVERALFLADFPKTAIEDESLLRLLVSSINDGLSDLHDIMVNANADWLQSRATISIINGVEEYDLPDDFYRLQKCYLNSSGRRFKIKRFTTDDIDGFRVNPLSDGAVEMWYTPQFKPLDYRFMDSTIDSRITQGWEDYPAMSAAETLLIREESDPKGISDQKNELKSRIINMAEPRDEGEPESVHDVSERWGRDRALLNFSDRTFKYRIFGTKIYFIEVEYLGV